MRQLFNDGHTAGPLFNQSIRRPSKKQLHTCGWWRRRSEYGFTPKHLLERDKSARKAIYTQCRILNKRDGAKTWCVDHIVPLNNPLVRGWHVSWNMRIIPYHENLAKSNNWWPDMPFEQLKLNLS